MSDKGDPPLFLSRSEGWLCILPGSGWHMTQVPVPPGAAHAEAEPVTAPWVRCETRSVGAAPPTPGMPLTVLDRS